MKNVRNEELNVLYVYQWRFQSDKTKKVRFIGHGKWGIETGQQWKMRKREHNNSKEIRKEEGNQEGWIFMGLQL
jgi:hypothetical protein